MRWLTLLMARVARARPCQTQGDQNSTWVVCAKVLELSATAFPGPVAGSWIRGRAAGTQASALRQDVSIAVGGLMCGASLPAPTVFSYLWQV